MCGLVEALLHELHLGLLPLGANSTKNKRDPLAGLQAETRNCILGLLSQGNGGVQRQRRTIVARWGKNSILIFDVHGVRTPGIIKSWLAPHLELDLAPDNRQGADNLIRLLPVGRDGHVVSQLGHTLLGKKSREQNVRVWQIQLSHLPFSELRLNLKTATVLIIE